MNTQTEYLGLTKALEQIDNEGVECIAVRFYGDDRDDRIGTFKIDDHDWLKRTGYIPVDAYICKRWYAKRSV